MRAAKVLSAIDFTESGLRWKFRKPMRRRCSLLCLTRQSLTAKRRLQSLFVQAKVAVCVCSRDELTRPMFVETNLGERRWYSGFSPFTALTFCHAWTGVFFVFGKRQSFPDAFAGKPNFTKISRITSKIVVLQNTITDIVFQNMSTL